MLIDAAGAVGAGVAGGAGISAKQGTSGNAASAAQKTKERNMVIAYLDVDPQVYRGLPRDSSLTELEGASVQSSARCASLMPARSSAATTRSNSATSGTGPMRTRYILRPAI